MIRSHLCKISNYEFVFYDDKWTCNMSKSVVNCRDVDFTALRLLTTYQLALECKRPLGGGAFVGHSVCYWRSR